MKLICPDCNSELDYTRFTDIDNVRRIYGICSICHKSFFAIFKNGELIYFSIF